MHAPTLRQQPGIINESAAEGKNRDPAKWRVASGKWRVASGKWHVASGEWQVASGKWHVASGERQVNLQPAICNLQIGFFPYSTIK